MKLYFENIDPSVNSYKYWELSWRNGAKKFETRSGRIGSTGRINEGSYVSEHEAILKIASKIRRKMSQGYILKKEQVSSKERAKFSFDWRHLRASGVKQTAKGLHFDGIKPQLLKDWNGKKVPARAVMEPKINGVRAWFVFCGRRFFCFSRTGKQFNNVRHIAAELIEPFDGYVLDGELVGANWSDTITLVRSDESGNMEATFVCWDALTIKEADERFTDRTLETRREYLLHRWPKRTSFSYVLMQEDVSTPKEVKDAMQRFIDVGAEGGVLKDLDSTYDFKRSSAWTRVKPMKTGDFRITGAVKGSGKNSNVLGAIRVRGPRGIVSKVGSGFSDPERKKFWRDRKQLIGQVAEIKYRGIAAKGKLQFASFVRLRPDK